MDVRKGGTRAEPTRIAALVGIVILVTCFTFATCDDPYLHNNPYDPADSVVITVSGPDTLFSYGELGHFGAQVVPVLSDTAVQFAVSDSNAFQPAGAANFSSLAPPLYPDTRTVNVMAMIGQVDTTVSEYVGGVFTVIRTHVWRHVGSMNVVLTQRVTRIQLRCPDTHACDTLSAGSMWSVWVDGFDALGQEIVALHSTVADPCTGMPVVATFVARDTAVANVLPVCVRVATVTALKTGTTWIVATRGSLLDSLQLVVR
jgi:hypothetical protein